MTHEGGCVCGAVRYRTEGTPLRVSACHCTFCQKRTGSAFGVGAYFTSPGMRAVGLGTFDDPKWLKVERFGWFRSAHPWVIPPPGVEVFEKGALQPAK